MKPTAVKSGAGEKRRPAQTVILFIGTRVTRVIILYPDWASLRPHNTRGKSCIWFTFSYKKSDFQFVCFGKTDIIPNMSRLLYGSSNVYRNFSRSSLSQDLGLTLIECTRKTVFDAHTAALGSLGSGSLLVSSVLENFVCDVCRDLGPDEVSLFANQQISAHIEALASLLRNSPESRIAVSPLLHRTKPGKHMQKT